MQFLDKESEEILKLCVDNESTYPAILREQFEKKTYPDNKLRSIVKLLIDEGYLSTLSWGDNLPYSGRIEQKGRVYFHNKKLYVSKALREDGRFNLDGESENLLSKIIEDSKNNPDDNISENAINWLFLNESNSSARIVKLLHSKHLIEIDSQGIQETFGGFVCFCTITQQGKYYFVDKEKFIEEVLAFPKELSQTVLAGDQYNISSGNNSPVIVGNTGTISMEYSFEQAQEAIDEILNRLDELVVSSQRKEEILENLTEARKLVKEKKKHPLKIMLKGVYDILKDVGCSVLSSLLISKFGL